jgi:hypothetical protein
MIEVTIETIQVSLVSPHRIVVLKELGAERYLPIWIGACETEAISMQLQGVQPPRPMTHDLIVNLLDTLDAELQYVLVSALTNDTFYGRLVLNVGGEEIEVDCRTSDAMAVAVRVAVPIYVADEVMEEAGVIPEESLLSEDAEGLDVFRDFLNRLDMDDIATD